MFSRLSQLILYLWLLCIIKFTVLLGLLAGLWEFPTVSVNGKEPVERMWDSLRQKVLLGGGDIELHHHIGLVSLEKRQQSCCYSFTISPYTLHFLHYYRWFINFLMFTITVSVGM